MQAVILAAGKGTRLRPLTYQTPKTLLEIEPGVTILDNIIANLPDEIDEIVLVVNYLKEKIQSKYGDQIGERKIRYVEHEKLDGSAMAIRQCRDILKDDFLAMNGDDLYRKQDLTKLIKNELAVLVFEKKEGLPTGIVEMDKDDKLHALIDYPGKEYLEKNHPNGYLLNTGAYKLNQKFFDYEPVPMKKGSQEFGLPQTLALLAQDFSVKVVKARDYWQVNKEEDLERIRKVRAGEKVNK